MKEFDSPVYVLDLRSSLNRATIESAQPGKPIKVLVRPEGDESAKPIAANGVQSNDGKKFRVTVQTDAGQQTHEWTWSTLQEALRPYRT